jgi:uncharacterized protein YndB with AHSA1/START domain
MMAAMRIRHDLHYDASPEAVFAMLTDPAFRNRVCDAMDVVSREVSTDPGSDGTTSVRIDMLQRTKGLPGFARKVVGEESRVIQSEQWSGHTADLSVEMPGKPGHVTGRTTLSSEGSGTVETFEGEVKVSIPLIGGKLESLVAGLFTDGMDAERAVGVAWLKEDR